VDVYIALVATIRAVLDGVSVRRERRDATAALHVLRCFSPHGDGSGHPGAGSVRAVLPRDAAWMFRDTLRTVERRQENWKDINVNTCAASPTI